MPRKPFKHLNQYDRDRLEALLTHGHRQRDIAQVLGVDKSTISREVSSRQRQDGRYQAGTAEHKARIKRSNAKYQGMKIERYPALRAYLIEELKAPRAPDEIAGRMKREKRVPRVGKDAIYKWLYSPFGQPYVKYLCTRRSQRKRRPEARGQRRMIPNMRRQEELSPAQRQSVGYGEGDTFVSPKKTKTTASAAVVVMKHSKYIVGRKLPSLKPKEMRDAINSMHQTLAMETLVFDRGIENREHEKFRVDSYFCDPQAPWQKPLVESSIGLLRRWFWKKGTNLAHISPQEFQRSLAIINGKYRKSLNYLSAKEVAQADGILKS
jgi:transposase, IS30 family